MNDIEQELKISTLAELEDHLSQMSDLLYGKSIQEFGTTDFENLFRIVHSIKGNTRACGYEGLATFSHLFESKLILIKNGNQDFNTNMYDMCLFYLNTVSDVRDALNNDINSDIPLDDEATHLESFSKTRSLNSSASSKIKVLLIDDDENIQDIVTNYIESNFNASVMSCLDGNKGLTISRQSEFDVIICDYKMPECNGDEFISKVRLGTSSNCSTPIIFISGYKPEIKANHHIWDNVFFTDKPFTEQKLIYYNKCSLRLKEAQAA